MSAAAPSADGQHGAHAAHHTNYVKVWIILCGLLCVSIVGPMLGIKVVTLITAFGIAFVKAFLVIKHFMHLTIEKRFVGFLMITMLALMLVFFAGTSADVMKHDGRNWVNVAAKSAVERGLAAPEGHHEAGAAHEAAPAHGAAPSAPAHEAAPVPAPPPGAPAPSAPAHPE